MNRAHKRMPFAVLLLVLVVGALALLLALNTASAANEVDRHNAASADSQLTDQLIQLQNEVAASAAPGNIARVAEQLGMVPAGNPAFLRPGMNGRYTVLGSPAPATESALPVPPKATTSKSSTPKASSTATKTPTSKTPASKPTGTATSTVKATSKTTAKSTSKSTKPTSKSAAKSTTASTSKAAKPKTSSTPTPSTTPTPDPTYSLPGGAR